MDLFLHRIIEQRGPVEWVVAASSLCGEVLAARSIPDGQLDKDQDWFAILGLAGTTMGH